MPVVRELVNRISFKVNKADKKNTEKAMKDIQKNAKDLITSIKGIGKALGAAMVAGFVVGVKSFREFERDTAKINFFVRNQEEADKLFGIFDKIATTSDFISNRQARAATSILSTTTLTTKQIEELAPFIKELSLARPDLGFEKVAEVIQSIVTGGDLAAITQIIPGFKDEAERLSKTQFGKTFGDITGRQRGSLVIEQLIKSQDKISALAQKQLQTLDNQLNTTTALVSDIFLKAGSETAAATKEVIGLINDMLRGLRKSEGFWNTLRLTVEAIRDTLKFTIALFEAQKAQRESLEKQQGVEPGGIILRGPNAPIGPSTQGPQIPTIKEIQASLQIPTIKEVGTASKSVNQGGLLAVLVDAIKEGFKGDGGPVPTLSGPNAPIEVRVVVESKNNDFKDVLTSVSSSNGRYVQTGAR